ncbi:MAG: LLM class F420-dependent oxidoreductase [Chloroflexi bacterium]|nr:LLM class F420-dependent oxidoreductase [Chloroflexota bacterium]
MRFGFTIPHNWGLENPEDVIGVPVKAEELGYDSVWVNHHVLHSEFVLDRLGDKPYYDTLTTLTYAAALTKRVRLGTTVLVLPYFNPLVLAKTLAGLDALSGGRLIVGVGVGGLRKESEYLGSNFNQRGAYSDESIAIMKELWTKDNPEFEGRFFHFSGIKFSPKPTQKPHPPIWVGGMSEAAMRRVARLGDGWHPNQGSPDELVAGLERLKPILEAEGRDISDITLSTRCEIDVVDSAQAEQRAQMMGTPDQLLRTIEAYANLGVSEMVLSVNTDDVARIHQVMEAFAEKVMPRVNA